MQINGKPERKGGSGRIPDALAKDYKKYSTQHYTAPPELIERLEKFCLDEERAKSWVIQKALDMWLKQKGY